MDDIRKKKPKKKEELEFDDGLEFEESVLSSLPDEIEHETGDIIDLLSAKKKKSTVAGQKTEPSQEDQEKEHIAHSASGYVKVPFDKFVQLVATHDFEKVVEKHGSENVVLSTLLLTELANAHDENNKENRVPLFIVVGVIIGIVISYLLMKF